MNIILKKNFDKIWSFLVFFFGISIVFLNYVPLIEAITLRAYFTMGILMMSFVHSNENSENKFINSFFALLTFIVFSYIIYRYPIIVKNGGIIEKFDTFVGFTAILLILISGYNYNKNLLFIIVLFFLYAIFGKYVPFQLSHSGFSVQRIVNHVVWGSQGIFGVTIGVCISYIFLFMLFGKFLQISGLSEFINDFSLALIGDKPGGPAKVSVIASGLLGMINGSAVANVVTTGMITIPLMKKVGYKSEFAGGVEAAASTGGQFAPPIMGAVGFVMAEYLGIPYSKVMIAAIIPAFLYYLGVLTSVHLEAKKMGLSGLKKEELPDLKTVLKERGFLSIPIIVVVGMILAGYSPIYASGVGIIACIILSRFTKDNKIGIKEFYESVSDGTEETVMIAVSCILVGIMIGIESLSALGLNFGNLIMNSPYINGLVSAGILTMIMSIILGTGISGVAAYVIIVSVAVPILINEGAVPIAAHLFCLIYACLSNITPPVAISSYVASGIAKSDETKTSFEAMKIGITGFILPFYFLINPELLIGVSSVGTLELMRFFLTASFGVINISAAFEGVLFGKLNIFKRVMLFLVGLLMIDPNWITDVIGIIIFIIIFLSNRRNKIEKI